MLSSPTLRFRTSRLKILHHSSAHFPKGRRRRKSNRRAASSSARPGAPRSETPHGPVGRRSSYADKNAGKTAQGDPPRTDQRRGRRFNPGGGTARGGWGGREA